MGRYARTPSVFQMEMTECGAARSFSEETLKSMSVILKHGFAPYEQYTRHGKQGPWTDVYALSATIYACITEVVPDSATDRNFEDTVQKPSELGMQIKPALEAAILKGMNLRCEDRYQSAVEMADALENALCGKGIDKHRDFTGGWSHGTVIIPEDAPEENLAKEEAARKAKRTLILIAVVAVVIVMAGVALLMRAVGAKPTDGGAQVLAIEEPMSAPAVELAAGLTSMQTQNG